MEAFLHQFPCVQPGLQYATALKITEILNKVEWWAAFTRHFTHLKSPQLCPRDTLSRSMLHSLCYWQFFHAAIPCGKLVGMDGSRASQQQGTARRFFHFFLLFVEANSGSDTGDQKRSQRRSNQTRVWRTCRRANQPAAVSNISVSTIRAICHFSPSWRPSRTDSLPAARALSTFRVWPGRVASCHCWWSVSHQRSFTGGSVRVPASDGR